MSDDSKNKLIMPVARRRVLQGAAAAGAAGFTGLRPAFAQEPEKPKEIIVRAWGGVWEEAITEGVSEPFTEMTGIAIRHDLTEDNEIQPKVWAAVEAARRRRSTSIGTPRPTRRSRRFMARPRISAT